LFCRVVHTPIVVLVGSYCRYLLCTANYSQAAGDEGLSLLAEELLRSLEDPARAPGAASLIAGFCRGAGGDRREALQEHVDALMTVRFGVAFFALWLCVVLTSF
jgi:hypothetical protein